VVVEEVEEEEEGEEEEEEKDACGNVAMRLITWRATSAGLYQQRTHLQSDTREHGASPRRPHPPERHHLSCQEGHSQQARSLTQEPCRLTINLSRANTLAGGSLGTSTRTEIGRAHTSYHQGECSLTDDPQRKP
jgi:hypothetical protein